MRNLQIEKIVEVLNQSRALLVITGAGCSTASGIADYRDQQGAWKQAPPMQHQDFMASHQARQRYWARSQLGFPVFNHAQPNDAHNLLVSWEKNSRLIGLITQNVDGLHQAAGHQNVIDLHGQLRRVVCMHCGAYETREKIQEYLDRHNTPVAGEVFALADGDANVTATDFSKVQVPSCARCGGILKPDVVFFGDSVDKNIVDQAYDWVDRADVVLTVGTSLMVYSSFRFVRRAHARGIPIVCINLGVTRADELLYAKAQGPCDQVLMEIDGLLTQTD